MKITKRQIKRIIREMNPDGTISPDEDDQREDLLAHAEVAIDELIQYVIDEADRIGGGFRSPGIRAEVFKLMGEKIHRARFPYTARQEDARSSAKVAAGMRS